MKRLVLVGGGHSHLEVIRRIGQHPSVGLHVTLVAPQRFKACSDMLPGLIAGHYQHADCHIDLEALCGTACVDRMADTVVGLDAQQRMVHCASGASIAYDLASLDIGSAATYAPQGMEVAVEPGEAFLAYWDALRQRAQSRVLHIVTVGGGASGIEMTLSMQHCLNQAGCRAHLSIAASNRTILPEHPAHVRRYFERVLRERGVGLLTGARVTRIEDQTVWLDSGAHLVADHVVWALGPRAAEWPAHAGLAADEHGFVLVDRTLRSTSHPEIFAAGDIAGMRDHSRPKSGVHALRQGQVLAENLMRTLGGQRLVRYAPQRLAPALITSGDRHAAASWGGLSVHGAWVWRWKDRRDRERMARYRVA
ncbi:MAG: FAD-dependent oxidoreductase [Burkholderiales bacterium]|nr:FAD-dependent oxidoreductase [Burkholderiales bacterium]